MFSGPVVFAEGPDAVASATTTTTPKVTKEYATPTIPEGSTTYTVQAGDVFWKIAKYSGNTLDQLTKLNPQIKTPSKIYVGQKIIIKAPEAAAVTPPVVLQPTQLSMGIGNQTNFRVRGTNYSFNIATASVLFDENGKIVKCYLDAYEVGQTGFTGWPGTNETITVETATAEVDAWQTKREKGDAYNMASKATTGNEWYKQLDFYETFFIGKTTAELRTWFEKNTNALGKPINPATATDEAELAKLALLSDAEKAVLVDVVASATMSLSDSHAKLLEAVEEAYMTKVPVTMTIK